MKYFNILLVVSTIVGVASCSPKLQINNTTAITENIFYPVNADTAKFQYLTGFSSSKDIEIQSKFEESITGKKEIIGMSKPYGVTVAKSKIYVADIGLPGVDIIDLDKKSFSQFKPINKDFSFILSMDVDNNDDKYILDSKSAAVLIYNAKGNYLEKFNVSENKRPVRIKLKGDNIFIGDLTTGKINIYSKSTHKWINQIPKKEAKAGDDEFVYMLMDFDLDDNYIYILDAGASKVKIFTYEGDFVSSFGGPGNGYGLFVRPKSIAVDKEGNIMVSDAATSLVQMFNKDGQPLMTFGVTYEIEDGKWVPGLTLPTSMIIDYNNLEYFKPYVDAKYNLKYVVYIVNQSGSQLLKVYGRLELK